MQEYSSVVAKRRVFGVLWGTEERGLQPRWAKVGRRGTGGWRLRRSDRLSDPERLAVGFRRRQRTLAEDRCPLGSCVSCSRAQRGWSGCVWRGRGRAASADLGSHMMRWHWVELPGGLQTQCGGTEPHSTPWVIVCKRRWFDPD